MELSLDPRTLWRIAWRRKWFFIIPAGIVVALCLAVIALTPPIYRSQATILIEQQNIPEDLVPSLVGDYIDRRLDVISRRILLTDNLIQLIERHELYPDQRETHSLSELAGIMRDNIGINLIGLELVDAVSRQSEDTTVAFRVGFDYYNPGKAQQVANDLVSLYLNENLADRRSVATQTLSFLGGERAQIEQRIADLEDQITRFSTENREYLPTEIEFARRLLANLEERLDAFDRDLRSLRQQESFLQTQLAFTEEFDLSGAGNTATPEGQLELLRSELALAQARYQPTHPDVIRLTREVQSLEAVVGSRTSVGLSSFLDQENALVTELATLRERYTSDHPDVQRVERQLASLREALENATENAANTGRMLARNPTFVSLSAQLNSVQAQIGAIEEQQEALLGERVVLQERLARGPVIEQEFLRINRELESAFIDRTALADKEATAQLSGALEIEAVGERFVLVDPPGLPTDPVRPSETLILALGFVLAVGGGGVSVVAAELLDRSIRSGDELVQLIGDMPLVQIPTIVSPADVRRNWVTSVATVVLIVGTSVGGLVFIDRNIIPLDVLGYQIQERANAWMAENVRSQGSPPPVETAPAN